MPTDVPVPFAPIIFCGLISYVMGALFMDVFELAVLTFMFARARNSEKDCNDEFGPDVDDIKALENDIDEEALTKS